MTEAGPSSLTGAASLCTTLTPPRRGTIAGMMTSIVFARPLTTCAQRSSHSPTSPTASETPQETTLGHSPGIQAAMAISPWVTSDPRGALTIEQGTTPMSDSLNRLYARSLMVAALRDLSDLDVRSPDDRSGAYARSPELMAFRDLLDFNGLDAAAVNLDALWRTRIRASDEAAERSGREARQAGKSFEACPFLHP